MQDGVGTIKFNRPKQLNSFGGTMISDTINALRELDEHPDTTFTVITGEGRFFASGADVTSKGKIIHRASPHWRYSLTNSLSQASGTHPHLSNTMVRRRSFGRNDLQRAQSSSEPSSTTRKLSFSHSMDRESVQEPHGFKAPATCSMPPRVPGCKSPSPSSA